MIFTGCVASEQTNYRTCPQINCVNYIGKPLGQVQAEFDHIQQLPTDDKRLNVYIVSKTDMVTTRGYYLQFENNHLFQTKPDVYLDFRVARASPRSIELISPKEVTVTTKLKVWVDHKGLISRIDPVI
jgi:hypothetical protein